MQASPLAPPNHDTDHFWADPVAGGLIERAESRQVEGDHNSALELLDRAMAMKSLDAPYAMAARAASLFELGRHSEAGAQLEALRKHRPFSAIAFHRAAEAAEMSGDERLALRWFDMALSRCTDQLQLGERNGPELSTQVALLVFGRRRVRTSLGLPVDDLDRAGAGGVAPPKVAYPGALPPGLVTPETTVRVLFWARDQILPAAARWPTLVQVTDTESVVRERELDNRQLVIEEGARVVMVPMTVAQLLDYGNRTGEDPLDPMTRTNILHERYEQGHGIAWPPARNQTCWCGSQLKYKKCCGAIGLAAV